MSPAATRPAAADVEAALRAAFPDAAIVVHDDSAAHAGHAGARAGAHFHVRVVSRRFDNLSRPARHRLVYDALRGFMQQGIHALAIEAETPGSPGSQAAPSPAN